MTRALGLPLPQAATPPELLEDELEEDEELLEALLELEELEELELDELLEELVEELLDELLELGEEPTPDAWPPQAAKADTAIKGAISRIAEEAKLGGADMKVSKDELCQGALHPSVCYKNEPLI